EYAEVPPHRSVFSSTTTERPAFAARAAPVSAPPPEPTTTRSYELTSCSLQRTSQVGVRPAGDQRQVEVGLDAGLGGDDVGDRVHAVRGRDDDAGIADQAGLDRGGVPAVDHGEGVRV